jgi:fibro-slime domain-containing protein
MGFGHEGFAHNFHFTTEIHTRFEYQGGETFTFTGDDDLWLFINGRLAIDLGGLHPSLSATVDLDAQAATLGITPGHEYAMDIFHAERHTDASNFRIETTIECIVVE